LSSDGTIAEVLARGLYDSNGRAAVEVTVVDRAGRHASALAPRGSTVGEFEPVQMEDSEAQPRLQATAPAVRAVVQRVAPALLGLNAVDQTEVDHQLDNLDSSLSRALIGGNVTIATSMAVAQLGARQQDLPLHEHLSRLFPGDQQAMAFPRPVFNLIDGGLSPTSRVPHIEFLLFLDDHVGVVEAIATGIRVYGRVRALCYQRGYEGACSQQGAISVPLRSCEEGLEILGEALAEENADPGYRLGLDMAASDVWCDGMYSFAWADGPLDADILMSRYLNWLERYPICYIEDGFAASQVNDFAMLTSKVGASVMVAGDDLFASNVGRITDGATNRWANAAVVKPNQAGTVTDTVDAARAARDAGFSLVVSQRSGENEGAFISSLAIAVGARYVKVGGPSRMDRIAKINELIRVSGTQ
jgi:enolase